MAIYEFAQTALTPLQETQFSAAGVWERRDLQAALRERIDVIAPGCMVLADEFGEWSDSKRRIDLLCIDRQANIVVVELKRDEEGGHMELQALRYAAMVSTLTFADAVNVYRARLERRGAKEDPAVRLLEFLGWEEPREDEFAQGVRIVLASADFGKELTTAVLWLNQQGLDIRCVRLKPYALDGRLLVDVQQVIPLPEAQEYITQLKQKDQTARQDKAERFHLRQEFWQGLIPLAASVLPRMAEIKPNDDTWLGVTTGVPGIRWNFLVWTDSSGCDVYIDKGDAVWNKAAFDFLEGRRTQIDAAYGAPLLWRRMDDNQACRIVEENVRGGIRSPREEWHRIREQMVDAMKRLEGAIGPHLQDAAEHATASIARG